MTRIGENYGDSKFLIVLHDDLRSFCLKKCLTFARMVKIMRTIEENRWQLIYLCVHMCTCALPFLFFGFFCSTLSLSK